jgi:hypothetical protein
MSLLNREAILAAQDVKDETITVPEWRGEVRVRALTADARDAMEQDAFLAARDKKPLTSLRARIVARCVIDEQGALLFTEADVEALGKKSASALDRIYDAILRMNAMRQSDIEELEKNSVAAPGGDSSSASPSGSAKP